MSNSATVDRTQEGIAHYARMIERNKAEADKRRAELAANPRPKTNSPEEKIEFQAPKRRIVPQGEGIVLLTNAKRLADAEAARNLSQARKVTPADQAELEAKRKERKKIERTKRKLEKMSEKDQAKLRAKLEKEATKLLAKAEKHAAACKTLGYTMTFLNGTAPATIPSVQTTEEANHDETLREIVAYLLDDDNNRHAKLSHGVCLTRIFPEGKDENGNRIAPTVKRTWHADADSAKRCAANALMSEKRPASSVHITDTLSRTRILAEERAPSRDVVIKSRDRAIMQRPKSVDPSGLWMRSAKTDRAVFSRG